MSDEFTLGVHPTENGESFCKALEACNPYKLCLPTTSNQNGYPIYGRSGQMCQQTLLLMRGFFIWTILLACQGKRHV